MAQISGLGWLTSMLEADMKSAGVRQLDVARFEQLIDVARLVQLIDVARFEQLMERPASE